MRALVLAGGTGTRLRPFSHAMPKQLMPVANRPVLLHGLDNIRRAGVREVGIVVGPGDHGAQIEAAVGDGAALGLRVTWIRQEAPLGLAHAVAIARGFLGAADFVMYLGDNLLAAGIAEAAARYRADRTDAGVLVAKVGDPRRFGVAETDADGTVTALAEKPARPRSDLALVGVYFFTPRIHAAVARIRPSARGELEITDAIQDLLDHGGRVRAQEYTGYWKDTGTVDDLLDANRALLDGVRRDVRGAVDGHSTAAGAVVVEPGARIVRSRLVGPVIVGAGTVIRDSRVGPYVSVAGGCVLTGADIGDSIVLGDAAITRVGGIHRSLIGRSADVRAGSARHRLLLGDHTRVEVAR